MIFAFICFSGTVYSANEPIGLVISMYSGAWVLRSDGVKEALVLKTPIYRGDTISTDVTGKAQILFNDDTSLAVAPASVVNIDDFIFNTNKKPYFSAKVVKGASRVISGKIVEQNPIGFKMSSPHGTAGIRGTVVSVVVGPNDDIFSVDSIDPRHFVDVSQNANMLNTTRSALEGYSVVVNKNPEVQNFQRKTTVEEKALMNEVFSSKPVPAKIVPKYVTDENKSEDENESESASDKKSDASDNDNNNNEETDNAQSEETSSQEDSGIVAGNVDSKTIVGDGKTEQINNDINREPSIPTSVIIDNELPKTFNAFYAGNLQAAIDNFEGDFGFKVDLNTAKYTGGFMRGKTKGEGVFNAVDGTGVIHRDGSFSAENYNVTGTGVYETANRASMSGSVTQETAKITNWQVTGGTNGTIGGTGEGKIVSSINFAPFRDILGSYAGNLTTDFVSDTADSAEKKFGFDIQLISGKINDAYMYYSADDGALIASGGKGKAFVSSSNGNNFGLFTISGFNARGYGNYEQYGQNALLSGRFTDDDSRILIAEDTRIGNFNFTGGEGSRVDSLPGINNISKKVFYSMKSQDNDLGIYQVFFKGGFKVDLISGSVSDFFLYAARGADTRLWTLYAEGDGNGRINPDGTIDISLLIKEHDGYYKTSDGLSFEGKFETAGYNGLTATIKYLGKNHRDEFVRNEDWSKARGVINGPDYRLPFLNASYEGNKRISDTESAFTGFNINLVSATLRDAYVILRKTTGNLSVFNGRGVYDDGKISVNDWGNNIEANGSYIGYNKVTLSGFLNDDYNTSTVNILASGAGVDDINISNMMLDKTNSLKGTKAYYSSNFDNGKNGKIGFTLDLSSADITDAEFYVDKSDGLVYAHSGEGKITSNNLEVNWANNNIVGEKENAAVSYRSARLYGNITEASTLEIFPTTGDKTDINNVRFAVDTGEKKGKVEGTLMGNGVTNGSYAFNANLLSGVITGGKMDITTGSGSLKVNNGSGYRRLERRQPTTKKQT